MTKFYGVTEKAQYIFENVNTAITWLYDNPYTASLCSANIAEHHINETYFGFRRSRFHNEQFNIPVEHVIQSLNESGIDYSASIIGKEIHVYLELELKDAWHPYFELKQYNNNIYLDIYKHNYRLFPARYNINYFKMKEILPLIPLDGVVIEHPDSLTFTIFHNVTVKYLEAVIDHYVNKFSS